jgi:hypothetical protein
MTSRPLFEKRHFEWLADWCGMQERDARRDYSNAPIMLSISSAKQADKLVQDMVKYLYSTNPNFSRTQFLNRAAQVASGERVCARPGESYFRRERKVEVGECQSIC